MVLLAGAGLLLASSQHVLETDPGFQPEHVLTASLSLPERNTPKRFRSKLLPAADRPVATTAGHADGGHFYRLAAPSRMESHFTPEGYQPPPGANLNFSNHSVIFAQYLQTMGVPLLKGRYFTEADKPGFTPVLLVSESLAKRYWPNQDAIGKRLKWGPPESKIRLTVVGRCWGRKTEHTGCRNYSPIPTNLSCRTPAARSMSPSGPWVIRLL